MSKEKQDRIEELLRKLLLGGEIIDTQFYLFSTRSVLSNTVAHPRILCANNDLLTNASIYFSDLLNSTTSPHLSLIDITGDDQQIPNMSHIDDYGYGSDSDLDDDDSPSKPQKTQSGTSSPSSLAEKFEPASKDDHKLSKNGRESVAFDTSFWESVKGRNPAGARRSASQPTVQRPDQTAVLLPSLKHRRIFIKDTAFRTWYTLLYYLYTGQVAFLPLKSACMRSRTSLSSSLGLPTCSAKSMYRLAHKVGLDALCDEALAFLESTITEQNILKELTSSLLSRYPPLLDILLDMLYAHIASEPVIAGLPGLAKRIASNEFLHGADIVVGLHQRLVKAHRANVPQIPRSPSSGFNVGFVSPPKREVGLPSLGCEGSPSTIVRKKSSVKGKVLMS